MALGLLIQPHTVEVRGSDEHSALSASTGDLGQTFKPSRHSLSQSHTEVPQDSARSALAKLSRQLFFHFLLLLPHYKPRLKEAHTGLRALGKSCILCFLLPGHTHTVGSSAPPTSGQPGSLTLPAILLPTSSGESLEVAETPEAGSLPSNICTFFETLKN